MALLPMRLRGVTSMVMTSESCDRIFSGLGGGWRPKLMRTSEVHSPVALSGPLVLSGQHAPGNGGNDEGCVYNAVQSLLDRLQAGSRVNQDNRLSEASRGVSHETPHLLKNASVIANLNARIVMARAGAPPPSLPGTTLSSQVSPPVHP